MLVKTVAVAGADSVFVGRQRRFVKLKKLLLGGEHSIKPEVLSSIPKPECTCSAPAYSSYAYDTAAPYSREVSVSSYESSDPPYGVATYSSNAPSYDPPAPSPAPSYGTPVASYDTPAIPYGSSVLSYNPPAPSSYGGAYGAPDTSYKQPTAYAATLPSYVVPA